MTPKSTLAVAVSIGIAIGACAREAVRAAATSSAYANGGSHYTVVGASRGTDGYEADLNNYTAQGYRFVGALADRSGGSMLIFER
jgi:hypothetical protein